ncbi:hypothetical protein [[Phormidium] sp. ETS-05]|uniref:hypothetical protein n=1 Tax=[Phormidium] sp. ETS-05 TaxID=222819 RepID=UPI0018EF13D3|nr:hypothetical protein [[Phormidium] sp. ETS-05]
MTKDLWIFGLSLREAWAMIEVAGVERICILPLGKIFLHACGLPENSLIRKEDHGSTIERIHSHCQCSSKSPGIANWLIFLTVRTHWELKITVAKIGIVLDTRSSPPL